jgi:hypothetical protein
VLWLVQSLLPEIYLPACVIVGEMALLLMLFQLVGLLRVSSTCPTFQTSGLPVSNAVSNAGAAPCMRMQRFNLR